VSPPSARTVYLGDEREPTCVVLHPAAGVATADTAVLLVPPFGWDEVASYRSRRAWAQRLAADGHPTARLSLPGTGDSGGLPRDPGRLEAWTAAVGETAAWLQAECGARRMVAIGIGLGGMLACRATAAGASIDDLVLWATPSRGRGLVRQLRAFSRLEQSEFWKGLPAPPPLAEGEMEAGGFLLSADTVAELERVDLAELQYPEARARRVLLLGQDGINVEQRLSQAMTRAGISVTAEAGEGYAAMAEHPQRSTTPDAVIDRVCAWLAAAATSSVSVPLRARSVPQRDSGVLIVGENVRITEKPFMLQQPWGRLVGTLTEPQSAPCLGVCAVLLNAGGIYHIGPNRMWVEAARRWATRGVSTLRLDLEGIGDADGDGTPYADDGALYVPELVPQASAAIDALQSRGVADRFVIGGLCSGAYWALHAALDDDRVVAAMMLNPRAIVWDPGASEADDLRTLRTQRLSWAKIRRNASLRRAWTLAVWLVGSWRRGSEIDRVLARMESGNTRVLLLFADDEPLHTDLKLTGRLARLAQAPNVTLDYIRVKDHTLRPNWAQHQAHAAMDRALEREFASAGPDSVADLAGSVRA
jgi:alpha-beta hydrolase superfamily lysophospholipase